jgi:hypothetical protein
MPSTEWTPPTWMTVLAVDAMYFNAAKEALSRAAKVTKAIEKAERRVSRCQAKIDRLVEMREADEAMPSGYYDKMEPLALQMEDLEYGVGAAYGPFLQNLAAVHVFAAATLEAHVNIRGQELLSGRLLALFERLPLDAKWLFLPRLYGLTGFDPGAQPYQGFDRLIRIRNKLVHYKVQREPWCGSDVPPQFLEAIGLSMEAAEESVVTAKSMAKELARQLGERAPWWLEADNPSYFEIEQEREYLGLGEHAHNAADQADS